MLTTLGLVLLLALLNGFFALSEIAVVASHKNRLKQHARHSVRARTALGLVERPENTLSTVQVGITLIGIILGISAGASIGSHISTWLQSLGLPWLAASAAPVAMVVSVAMITFINITVGELVPKRLALLAPERIATQIAVPMLVIARIATPFVWVLNATSSGILRLFGMHGQRKGVISEEEIRLMVAESAEQGVLDSDERNMVNRVLRLGDRDVESVMTPRPRIAWLDAEADLAENLAVLSSTPYSRYPVFEGDESNIVGILEVKTLIEDMAGGSAATTTTAFGNARPDTVHDARLHGVDLFHRLAKPFYAPASARALDLFEGFRTAETGMALAVDEYGDIEGLVTVNDLLGTVVGRSPASRSASADIDDPVVQRADGSYLLDGALSCDDLRELLGEGQLPNEDEHEFNTVAGMLMAEFGRIPDTGQSFSWHDNYFEVVDLDGTRIDKVLLVPPREEASESA